MVNSKIVKLNSNPKRRCDKCPKKRVGQVSFPTLLLVI